jgi:alkylhydroperoxidase/carboxymuconolactone decarboxylase family protein YurZ
LIRIALYSKKEENPMTRQEILDQISQTLGGVPGWLDGLPDSQLEHQWGLTAWLLSDSKLSARDKALVAFGAAAAARCQY